MKNRNKKIVDAQRREAIIEVVCGVAMLPLLYAFTVLVMCM